MKNAERVKLTQGKLLAAGSRLFAANGFADTSTDQILAEAGVTRGALYHHFADKTALFEAVCDQLSKAAADQIETAIQGVIDPLAALEHGFDAWFAYVLDPGVRRVLLIEAPTVLGYERWRRFDDENSFQSLREGVGDALAAGALLFAGDADDLAAMINGAANDLALRDVGVLRATSAIRQLIAAFRPR